MKALRKSLSQSFLAVRQNVAEADLARPEVVNRFIRPLFSCVISRLKYESKYNYIRKIGGLYSRENITLRDMENYESRIWKGMALAILFACALMRFAFWLMFDVLKLS